ncbi:hypothetical protein OSB04_006257 [Centaurea solstitialis]|uniref:Uncharacterized protein n=1 Tax=Centaurea solstitialis TaxID=347529 RepID=A0AA38WH98_9ASTR|nr:hypothetical protein OSB04_006257 [Centaurea solstitialis]
MLPSSSLSEQIYGVSVLCFVTKRFPEYRVYFNETPDSIIQCDIDPDFHRELITTLMNVLIQSNNTPITAQHPNLVPTLVRVTNWDSRNQEKRDDHFLHVIHPRIQQVAHRDRRWFRAVDRGSRGR